MNPNEAWSSHLSINRDWACALEDVVYDETCKLEMHADVIASKLIPEAWVNCLLAKRLYRLVFSLFTYVSAILIILIKWLNDFTRLEHLFSGPQYLALLVWRSGKHP